MSKRLSRRTVLRGLAAGSVVSLGLPTLDAMLPTSAAAAEAELGPIFGVFFWANGLPWHAAHGAQQASLGKPDLWTPAQTGAGYTPSTLLQPLARHSPSVVTGLRPHTDIPSSPGGQGDGHMRGFMVALTSDRPRSQGFDHPSHTLTSRRASIDQVIARDERFYADESPRYRSLQVGVSTARFHDYGHWNGISYNGPDSLNLPVHDVGRLYEMLFAVPSGDADLARRADLLDAVLDDASDLRGRLGGADQARLDEHLEGIFEVQRRLELGGAVCEAPARPTNSGSVHEQTTTIARLLSLGLACNLTRVFSFMLTSPATTHVFRNLGVTSGLHKACHDGSWDWVRAVSLHQQQAFARLLDELDSHLDPTGTSLLERAVILGTSEYGEGWKHSVNELPAVLAGGGCGTLNRGVHVRDVGGNYCKTHVTVLRALGLDTPSFGFSGAETSDAFDALLT
ncbi:MAG: DUF1552 domain-containing protein [Myxococcota bacterium]